MDVSSDALFIRPKIFSSFPHLIAAQSTRHGGVSKGDIGSLNLGAYTEDDEASVNENQQRFMHQLGFSRDQLAYTYQVHGKEVKQVQAPGHWKGYDALITDQKEILLAITTADCTPILLFDPVRQAIGGVHAGWRGTIAQALTHTIRAMQEAFGTDTKDLFAWVGVCIGKEDYEVDADVADHFPASFKSWQDDKGKYLLDLRGANQQQLLDMGVPNQQIGVSTMSTVTYASDFFSHRASRGKAGRAWAVIGMKG